MIFATDTRDAVVTAINSAGLTPALTAVAIYEITFDLQDLTGGRLVVVPQTQTPQLINRKAEQRKDTLIDIAVQYKYAAPTSAELDPYQKLIQSIAAALLGKRLSTGEFCTEVKYPHGFFLAQHMQQFQVFTSVLTAAYAIAE